ncbi:MAG: transcription-repair coupling factor, partial [Planctomycetota bacterium]
MSASSGQQPGASAFAESLGARLVVPLVAEAVARGGTSAFEGSAGSLPSLVAAEAARASAPALLVVAHLDEADDAVEELQALGAEAMLFPALEVLPGETSPSAELLVARLSVVRRLAAGDAPGAIVAPIAALMQAVPTAERLARLVRPVRVGARVDPTELVAWLVEGGYRRVDAVESPGEVAVRGGIVDVAPPGGATPVRLDFFGDEIERIFEIDIATQASDRRVDAVEFVAASVDAVLGYEKGAGTQHLARLLPPSSVVVLAEMSEIVEQARAYWDRVRDGRGVFGPPATLTALAKAARATLELHAFGSAGAGAGTLGARTLPVFDEDPARAIAQFLSLAEGRPAAIVCANEGERARMTELLAAQGAAARIARPVGPLVRGYLVERGGDATVVAPASELLHRDPVRHRARTLAGGRAKDAFLAFEPGDYVVHRDHGIARFVGLQMIAPDAADSALAPDAVREQGAQEFLTLEFDGGAKIHVPASRIELVQRYVGSGGTRPKLSTLGGRRWKRTKEEAEESARDFAAELLRVQAARAATRGVAYPPDSEWQREFESQFPYEETEDQLSAIAAAKRDMESARPMDRLVCGDVGFGKTEVAIRAAFKAVESGRQVGVLVPTTVLAEQHERTFRDRFKAYPFRIESLSRFKTGGEVARILKDVATGQVDVVIGTHRLLSQDVKFADLGLVVVDEEQRFGVEHKQRLLAFRLTADVLTLSATPIPRTLHMSLMGLRDISSLTTPPPDRRAIVTEVLPWNPRRVQEAIRRELSREGQVFFVHNRVHDIEEVAARVKELVPEARVIVGHGQMTPAMLEGVMLAFMRHEADILVSTTIIESGIDIPTANTMVIHDADIYGLAELHQLRGRVGRSRHRAYCYLMLPADRTITEDAMKRLKAIEDYSMLGAGFRIAMRDLEIRGAGNLLGSEQ